MTRTGWDVVVIGAGIHGCAAAFYLSQRGLSVLVLEKDRIAQHASSRSAGGVRQLGRDLAEVPLSAVAMELWYDLRTTLGEETGFRVSGQVRVAENEADMAVLAEREMLMRECGYGHEELLDRAALRELLPRVSEHCVGGLISRRDGFANPYQTTLAFANAARSRGVEIREGCRVVAVDREAGQWCVTAQDGSRVRGVHLLNAAGAWGNRIAEALGEPVPLGYAAYMITMTSRVASFVGPVVIGTGRPLSLKQLGNGAVMMGGGYTGSGDLDGQQPPTVDVAQLSYNVRTAVELFPVLAQASVARSWAGFEGVMPDHLPVIGRSREPDAFHAFGFCGHGFQLAPAVGSLMAELIATGRTNLPIEPFRIDRFTTDVVEAPAPG